MTVRTIKFGGTDWGEEYLDNEELNDTFEAAGRKTEVIYTGSGYDSSITAGGSGGGSDEQSHELTTITSSELANCYYLEITILGTSEMDGDSGTRGGSTEIKIQTKDVGGSYSDSLGYTTIFDIRDAGADDDDDAIHTNTIRWIHTLTANEKSNGITVKIYSKSTVKGTGSGIDGTCTFTNIQTVLTPIN